MVGLVGLGLGADGLERQTHAGLQVVVSDPMVEDDELVFQVPGALTLKAMPHRVTGLADLVDQIDTLCRQDGQPLGLLAFMVGGNPLGFWIGKDWISIPTLARHSPALVRLAGLLSKPDAVVGIYCHEEGLSAPLKRALSDGLGHPVSDTLGFQDPRQPIGPKGHRPGGYRFATTAVTFDGDENMASLTYW